MTVNDIIFSDELRITKPVEREAGWQVVIFSPFIKRPLGFPTMPEQVKAIKRVARLGGGCCLMSCLIKGFNLKNYKRQLKNLLQDISFEVNRRKEFRELIEDCDPMDIVSETEVAEINNIFNVQ